MIDYFGGKLLTLNGVEFIKFNVLDYNKAVSKGLCVEGLSENDLSVFNGSHIVVANATYQSRKIKVRLSQVKVLVPEDSNLVVNGDLYYIGVVLPNGANL